jgi:hypothetical protein
MSTAEVIGLVLAAVEAVAPKTITPIAPSAHNADDLLECIRHLNGATLLDRLSDSECNDVRLVLDRILRARLSRFA